MSERQGDVLVKMKNFHLRPVDPRRLRQSIEKFELRCSRRSDDPRTATLSDGAANGHSRLFGSRLPQRDSILEYFDQHAERSGTAVDCASQSLPIIQRARPSQRELEPEF